MRADARRNYEKLINAAREVFTEHGADASLDEIAKRAGVGPGTLYRHFPNRRALQEATYRDGVEQLCTKAYMLAESAEPEQALVAWLHECIGYITDKRCLADALMIKENKDS